MAGLYAACFTLVRLANPFLLGLSSILAPIAARAFSEEGKIGVRRVVSKYLLTVTVLLIGFAGILSLTGDTLLRIILDASYQANQSTINVLSLAMFGIGINFDLANGLYALGHPRQDLDAVAIGLSVTSLLAWPFIASPYLGCLSVSNISLGCAMMGPRRRFWFASRHADRCRRFQSACLSLFLARCGPIPPT